MTTATTGKRIALAGPPLPPTAIATVALRLAVAGLVIAGLAALST
jgi:hypothetical protein